MGIRWSDGYSSDVKIDLLTGGKRFAIAQIGPEWFILRDEAQLPEGFAQIFMKWTPILGQRSRLIKM